MTIIDANITADAALLVLNTELEVLEELLLLNDSDLAHKRIWSIPRGRFIAPTRRELLTLVEEKFLEVRYAHLSSLKITEADLAPKRSLKNIFKK